MGPTPANQPAASDTSAEFVPHVVGANVAGMLAGADAGSGMRLLQALQRSPGNAVVASLVGVQRSAAEPIVQRAFTPKERQKLDNARRLIDKAKASRATASKSLDSYASAAPGKLAALKSQFDASLSLYSQASSKVNYKIEQTKAIAKVRNEVLMTLVDAVTGPIVKKIDSVVMAKFQTAEADMQAAFTPLSSAFSEVSGEFTKPFAKPVGEAKEAVTAAAGMGEHGAGGAGTPAWASELDFLRAYSALEAKGNRLLPYASATGKVGEPIGRVDQALKDVNVAGKALSYPIDKLDKDAAILENGTRLLAAGAPKIAGMVEELETLVTLGAATAPKNVDEVEDEIWIQWISDLGHAGGDILDEDYLEEYLAKRGIFERLGIERGRWFSGDEEQLAIVSAKAMSRVAALKGTEFDIKVNYGTPLGDVDLPGLSGPLPIRMLTGSGVSMAGDVLLRAVVIGAEKNKTLETDMLKQSAPNIADAADYLLRTRCIRVLARPVEVKQSLVPAVE